MSKEGEIVEKKETTMTRRLADWGYSGTEDPNIEGDTLLQQTVSLAGQSW
jgi:hypothetical protein